MLTSFSPIGRSLVLGVLIASPAAAQMALEPIDTRQFKEQAESLIKAHQQYVRDQFGLLQRQTDVLDLLADSADTLIPGDLVNTRAAALAKVEEAREVATKEPPLPDFVVEVIDRVERLIESDAGDPSLTTRQRLFTELLPLRRNILSSVGGREMSGTQIREVAEKVRALSEQIEIRSDAVQSHLLEIETRALGGKRSR
jgi:hypothetical protein